MDLSGKSVVITGAGSGIGRALAAGFCADGASVLGIGRSAGPLAETERLCNGKMRCVTGDVALAADVERAFAEAQRAFGKVDVVVNNAALYPKSAFLEAPMAQWIQAIEVNVIGVALCCRAALPGMLERGFGRIINLGSLAWRMPIPKSSAYSASKAAVRAFTIGLAAEIDRDRYPDVLVNELLPGIVRTRMSDEGMDPAQVYPYVRSIACLPKGGPHGRTFLEGALYVENTGMRARARRLVARLLGRTAHD